MGTAVAVLVYTRAIESPDSLGKLVMIVASICCISWLSYSSSGSSSNPKFGISMGPGSAVWTQELVVELSVKPSIHSEQSKPSIYVRQFGRSNKQLPRKMWVPGGHEMQDPASNSRQHCPETYWSKAERTQAHIMNCRVVPFLFWEGTIYYKLSILLIIRLLKPSNFTPPFSRSGQPRAREEV